MSDSGVPLFGDIARGKQKNRREWHLFCDMSYFDLYCVKPVEVREFGSSESFHFMELKDAREFFRLIEVST